MKTFKENLDVDSYDQLLLHTCILLLLSQVNNTVQRLAADKGELLQQHADEVDQYERRIRSLTEEVS